MTTLKFDHLEGKKFTGIGQEDCFQLVTDFYFDNFGIKLRKYARPQDWKSDRDNLILKSYEREGFEKITDIKAKNLRPGDILAIAIGEANPNHLAVYLGKINGEHKIVHHLLNRLSNTEELQGFWLNQTCFILRHPDVPDLRPALPTTTIEDILNARNDPPTG